tara:strand:- start:749 stop:1117 length:369 start_codon:yes stop_codon:yes gene_type:complete
MPPKNKRQKILAEKAADRKKKGKTSGKKKAKKAKKEDCKNQTKISPEQNARNARKKEFAAAKSRMKTLKESLNERLKKAGHLSLDRLQKNTQLDPELDKDVKNYFKEKKSSNKGKGKSYHHV